MYYLIKWKHSFPVSVVFALFPIPVSLIIFQSLSIAFHTLLLSLSSHIKFHVLSTLYTSSGLSFSSFNGLFPTERSYTYFCHPSSILVTCLPIRHKRFLKAFGPFIPSKGLNSKDLSRPNSIRSFSYPQAVFKLVEVQKKPSTSFWNIYF